MRDPGRGSAARQDAALAHSAAAGQRSRPHRSLDPGQAIRIPGVRDIPPSFRALFRSFNSTIAVTSVKVEKRSSEEAVIGQPTGVGSLIG
jgi:hypothetical protein